MKIWMSDEENDRFVIIFYESIIYWGKPKKDEIEDIKHNLNMGIIPKNITGIPLSYIKQIRKDNSKTYIEVLYNKDSSEHLRVKNKIIKNEIFEYFKLNINNSGFFIDHYSKIRIGRKPLIAMLVVTAIFLWSYNIASGIENGNDYKIVGSYRSLASVVLMIAALGTKNVCMIFGCLFAISLTSFILKIRKPKMVEKIIINRK